MQVKRCDDMARKLRFFTDQASIPSATSPSALHELSFLQGRPCCCMFHILLLERPMLQVDKSGLITGTRLGAEREFDFDELEVCICGA